MKLLQLFFVLHFVIIVKINGEIYDDPRLYTVELGTIKTIALHFLQEQPDKNIKLLFPKENITFNDLVNDITIYSPSINEKCEDKSDMDFWLMITYDLKWIRGKIKMELVNRNRKKVVRMYLYEKCGSEELQNPYGDGYTAENPVYLNGSHRLCFKNPDPYFAKYGDDYKEIILKASGQNFSKCQIFMILPEYLKIEEFPLSNASRLSLNPSLAAINPDEKFWWKNASDSKLPSSIKFDESDNVKIDILKSKKDVPIFLRIGTEQPVPSFRFEFSSNCIGKYFELYLNLRDTPDCLIGIHLIQNGIEISTKGSAWQKIKGAPYSPTLIFGTILENNYVFVKFASISSNGIPSSLFIEKFEGCEIPNSPLVPADEMVLKVDSWGDGVCDKATITLTKEDVEDGIEVLIDNHDQSFHGTTIGSNGNSTVSSVAAKHDTANARIEWWYCFIGGIALLAIIVIVLLVYFLVIQKRCCKKPPKENGPML